MGDRENLINRRNASSDLQEHEIAEPDWRNASQDIKDGLSNMLPAARTRANATYYGFIVLSIGLIVMIIILMHESWQWRQTVKAEGELWRGIVREVVHDIGFV
ncbi:hypothetical protein COCSUDRAFT_53140 [Coccomyxa subellipsoidea C-169]|uniref:Uncharacterized protein n=1 Tax=Coccomyxa subellipsoidea (strain C-169) TaxID=574566 RepID=I0YZN3_COCSC|nr:hypothetical protein COCSUDRAFT_53140 [Coccomyxa subellipsoidea C-169]EIE23852.1 hypothetical protein COCSUDRAFT_53140 [Coccomyxa subellipsoidea C-169]|eukprot:XP_005648396.1 hypothetical protein COCSUDRAFT_53140 [Coccomyxa subellipsoidea C-169]